MRDINETWKNIRTYLPHQLRDWPLRAALSLQAPFEAMRWKQLRRLILQARRSKRRTPSVVHCVGHMGPGGAERQLTYLTREARRRGLDHSIISLELQGTSGHYMPALRSADVPVWECARSPANTLPHAKANMPLSRGSVLTTPQRGSAARALQRCCAP